MDICMVCDPMLDTYGPVAPALLLAQNMMARNYRVSIVSTRISSEVQRFLKQNSLAFVNLDAHLISGKEPPFSWLEVWAREAFLKLNSRGFRTHNSIVINFSHTLAVPSTVWYVQGPTTDAIRDMQNDLPLRYRFLYKTLKPLLEFADNRLIRNMASGSNLIIANSKYCASMYETRNLDVDRIIYPPLDCKAFKPTPTPQNDYVLTYLGKETDFSTLKKIGDAGVRVRIFGSKSPFKPKQVLKRRNIEFLGRVSTQELVGLYSNALFTLFTFNHEPFGYIPVESMACGTPVLTYNSQGPSETVIDGVTGWLANTREESIRLALSLWKGGYPPTMRANARERALRFSEENIAGEWIQVVERLAQETS
ncbi:MAG: glycosyltransferase family 4 protein [Candidatus Bathyarchaeia archaeon]